MTCILFQRLFFQCRFRCLKASPAAADASKCSSNASANCWRGVRPRDVTAAQPEAFALLSPLMLSSSLCWGWGWVALLRCCLWGVTTADMSALHS